MSTYPPFPQDNSSATTPESAKQELFKVELDERCILFPDGKIAQHLLIGISPERQITLDLVFAFNRTRLPPRIGSLTVDDTREFARDLVAAVYQARTAVFLSDHWKITINVIPNGYYLEFLAGERRTELFLSVGVIWRVIKALLMAIDAASPIASH